MTGFVVQGHIYVIIGHLLLNVKKERKKERKKESSGIAVRLKHGTCNLNFNAPLADYVFLLYHHHSSVSCWSYKFKTSDSEDTIKSSVTTASQICQR